MAEAVIMPRQGLSVESCILSEWKKEIGEEVEKGDILFAYETDKSTFELESEKEGYLLEKFYDEGEEVPVFENVCVIGEKGENTDEFKADLNNEGEEEVVEKNEKEKEEESITAKTEQNLDNSATYKDDEAMIKISPRARKLAEKNNLDYTMAEPTGPEGRIIERDINKLLKEGPVFTPAAREMEKGKTTEEIEGTGIGGRITTADLGEQKQKEQDTGKKEEIEYEDRELTHIRKSIAENMYQSVQSTAQLSMDISFDATAILDYRKKVKANQENMDINDITLNDIILFAVSRTLLNHEKLNAHLLDDKIRLFKNVNLGMAVDTERGLMVPTIFNVNKKSLNQISQIAKTRIQDCKEGTINPDYLKGATFTVTNLGTLEIESFTPILNPPQTGILGVNTIVQRVKKVEGEPVYYPAMNLSLTFDHRAIDGAPAAKFLKELKDNLENFSLLMAK
ncbi:MAG: dihydrolipoamide acetyltransferase family protein [Bacillota bacterium]